jgi:hypothetical protein
MGTSPTVTEGGGVSRLGTGDVPAPSWVASTSKHHDAGNFEAWQWTMRCGLAGWDLA